MDSEGREWKLDLRIGTCDLVLEKCGFDLLEPSKYADKIQSAMESPRQLLDFLWVIVEGQNDIKDRDLFLDGIYDVNAAKHAVYEELEDFFQRSATDFLKVFSQMKLAARKILDAQEKKVRDLLESGELEEHLNQGMENQWNQALKKATESQSTEQLVKQGSIQSS